MTPSHDPIKTHPDLYGALIREISIIHQQFSTRANQDLKTLNLNFSQLSLLSHMMFLKTPASITELAEQMDLNQPAVTKMVQHLAEHGWIEMQTASEDARKKYVVLKEEGRGVFKQAQQALFPLLQLSFDGLALQEAQVTLHQLQQIRKNLARKL